MNTICVMSLFFGKLPNTFEFWKQSVGNNSTIDFVLITDCKDSISCPKNLKIAHMPFEEVKKRLQALIPFSIKLDNPYKLCDYRPAFGEAFSDLFAGYNFWGYADMDLVFGNLRNFLTDKVLSEYDKIYHQGHFSLYRNCVEMNHLYKRVLPDGKAFDYRFAYTTNHPCFFDESCGMERICKYDNVKMWRWTQGIEEGVLADIKAFDYEFRFSIKGTDLHHVYFEYKNGDLKLCSDEISIPAVYAHFAKRKFEVETSSYDEFFIVPNKYVPIDSGYPAITEAESLKYYKSFKSDFRMMKAERAFRYGIIKYIEKIMKKRKFIPL